ncbi:hypothetical protein KY312_01950, partial [Candidatus Woesearchaeota archaeon]|nr:hypothetical protein [Candidatus Woesearchaeota archaeon]
MKKIINKIVKNKEILIDIIILLAIFVFLLSYFKPSLILSDTTTNGGDTPSHITTAKYLKEYLLPRFKIFGWWPGAYAGMTLLQYYFPLPFLLIVFFSYVIQFEVAFKIVTILGTFLLPICTYFCFRLMKFKFPAPIIAAIFTLVFLFNESNSMWGGNIPSTLAGEFSYSLGLSLSILYFGFLYKGINSKKYLILNSILIFIIGVTHVYTLILIVFGSAFFLLSKKKFVNNFKYLFTIFFISFLLLSFWALPLNFKLGYTTPYPLKWHFQSYKSILPTILLPFLLIAACGYIIALIKRIEREKFDYFLFTAIISIVFFALAYYIGVVDIRFLPFVQLFVIFISVESLDLLTRYLKLKILVPF